jgi:hypothetical protein
MGDVVQLRASSRQRREVMVREIQRHIDAIRNDDSPLMTPELRKAIDKIWDAGVWGTAQDREFFR